jgi:hypothetical protein
MFLDGAIKMKSCFSMAVGSVTANSLHATVATDFLGLVSNRAQFLRKFASHSNIHGGTPNYEKMMIYSGQNFRTADAGDGAS